MTTAAAAVAPTVTPGTRVVVPRAIRADLLLTARTAISHHDPATQDDSNRMLFNRRKQLVPAPAMAGGVSRETADALGAAFPAADTVAPLLAPLPLSEFVACALVRLFIDIYGGGNGSGLFAGTQRYEMLETRLRHGAVRATSLRALWNYLCHDLQVGVSEMRDDALLLRLFALPPSLQASALHSLTREYRYAVLVARNWSQENKCAVPEYAAKAKMAVTTLAPLRFTGGVDGHDADSVPSSPAASGVSAAVIEVPAVSGNSARHQVVRNPGWLHLAGRLGLPEGPPGGGELPLGAEAIFVNGGNIKAGSAPPADPFGLAQKIRQTFPLLDLLGGVGNGFDLGASKLAVDAVLVCRENAAQLRDTPAEGLPEAGVSAFDMLDDETRTRQATERGEGQMIYSYESLAPGTVVLVRLVLSPYTAPRTRGALAAAVETYLTLLLPVLGGQRARGHGWMRGEIAAKPDDWEASLSEYEHYLDGRRDDLRGFLADGTLGTGTKVVS